MSDSSNGREVEVDQHGQAGRQMSALLSAALAAAQAAAQVAAQRARQHTRQTEQQARHAEQQTREQQRQAQQADTAMQLQLERRQRTEQAVRHRQWSLKPTAQWLHDNPLSAAAAWASADVDRGNDPVAARHAEQWETVFQREGIDVADVRVNAPAAAAAQTHGTATGSWTETPAEVIGELAAAEVATGAVVAGAVDAAETQVAGHARSAAGTSHWSAYADGAPAATLGGRGVSTPPNQVLAQSRETPDLAATAPQRAAELVPANGLDR